MEENNNQLNNKCICNQNGKYIYDPKCPQHPDESKLGILERENSNLRTVMVAAAEEIQEHWQAHCDEDGYGPANLMHRLEKGIAAYYPGYTSGAFEKMDNEISQLKKQLEEAMIHKTQAEEFFMEVIEWGQRQKDIKIGDSITEGLFRRLKEYDDLKSKLEVKEKITGTPKSRIDIPPPPLKEKPDFHKIANEDGYYESNVNNGGGFYSYCGGMKRVWEEFVIPRDAKISDLQAQNKSLLDKIADLKKFNETQDLRWREHVSKLESELKEAKELLTSLVKECKYGITQYLENKTRDFLKDKR